MFSKLIMEWRLRRKLKAYVATLSPEKQAAANALRKRLDSAKTPAAGAAILVAEAQLIREKQFRAIEAIDRLTLG